MALPNDNINIAIKRIQNDIKKYQVFSNYEKIKEIILKHRIYRLRLPGENHSCICCLAHIKDLCPTPESTSDKEKLKLTNVCSYYWSPSVPEWEPSRGYYNELKTLSGLK